MSYLRSERKLEANLREGLLPILPTKGEVFGPPCCKVEMYTSTDGMTVIRMEWSLYTSSSEGSLGKRIKAAMAFIFLN
jgi:hypothetical protein